jgi:hypothetical protein
VVMPIWQIGARPRLNPASGPGIKTRVKSRRAANGAARWY